ncbi:FHA domain-containing protein [Streptomyces sp. AK04-3B]|uniref:FHA domain-containing protein n=1 Tax=Streptomyces sp. AK04-3B TaxID=3028650 RepID=UPI0029BA07D3|nr:FHA domain-containing protein [Streptomyces sp. AK04-3B]MDX3798918.1 FHA domain-containing protein [Streptomyces sp. AK04-3B]
MLWQGGADRPLLEGEDHRNRRPTRFAKAGGLAMDPPLRERDLPHLVVDRPDRLRGRVFLLDDQPTLVGRDSDCQIQVGDPGVSRRHAVVWRASGRTTVEDLASTNGTMLNGRPVFGQQVLHSGDVLDFGPLEVHYEEPRLADRTVQAPKPTAGGASATMPGWGPAPEPGPTPYGAPAAGPPPPSGPPGRSAPREAGRTPPGGERRFDVGAQQADRLSNVAGDQYNYVQQAQRESFFQEIAATRTRARHLIVLGFLLFLVGGGIYGWVIIRFIARTNDDISSGSSNFDSSSELLGPKVAGVPVGAVGFAMAAIGTVLTVIGIVLHIVTTSRRRRFEDAERQASWQR